MDTCMYPWEQSDAWSPQKSACGYRDGLSDVTFTTQAVSLKDAENVLHIVTDGPPILTFPHPNFEAFFEVALARVPER